LFETKIDETTVGSKIDLSLLNESNSLNSTRDSFGRWSPHNPQLVAFVFSSFPTVVWIWNVLEMKALAVLIQEHPVKDLKWDPVSTRLAITCGLKTLYCWSPKTSFMVQIPRKFNL
jgi:hypothetical protein